MYKLKITRKKLNEQKLEKNTPIIIKIEKFTPEFGKWIFLLKSCRFLNVLRIGSEDKQNMCFERSNRYEMKKMLLTLKT